MLMVEVLEIEWVVDFSKEDWRELKAKQISTFATFASRYPRVKLGGVRHLPEPTSLDQLVAIQFIQWVFKRRQKSRYDKNSLLLVTGTVYSTLWKV